MGEMKIMGVKGDTKAVWDPSNHDEVESIRKQFKDLRKKRFKAYRVSADGKKSSEMTDFDPDAAKIIFVPPMAGGGVCLP